MSKRVLSLVIFITMLFTFTACGNGSALIEGKTVYDEKGIFELSESNSENYSVNVSSKGTGKVEKIIIGSKAVTEGFSYKKGVLTIKNEVMKGITAGEKQLRIYFEKKNDSDNVLDGTKQVLLVNKVIRTADDFQSIGDNLNGAYILANDIDCSSIASFKPFGRNSGDSQNPNNKFFHGILEGNGYTISNVNVDYLDLEDDPFYNKGQVLGVFTSIGTAGIVRNTIFDGIRISSRTIAGAICGETQGKIQNCAVLNSYVSQDCGFGVTCNAAVAIGIVAGGGLVENCYTAASAAISRGGYYLAKAEDGITDMWMTFSVSPQYQLAFCGKTWGQIKNCVAEDKGVMPQKFCEEKVITSINNAPPFNIIEAIPAASHLTFFTFSRLDNDPNEGGDAFTGQITDCKLVSAVNMKKEKTYTDAGFDANIWNLSDGQYPSLKQIYSIT